VNLFEQIGGPLSFDHTQKQYPLTACQQMNVAPMEIYQVKALDIVSSSHRDEITCQPYFSRKFFPENMPCIYWHAQTRAVETTLHGEISTAQMLISLSDFNLEEIEDELILSPKLLCTNGNVTSDLMLEEDEHQWTFSDANHEFVADMQTITPITSIKYRELNQQDSQLLVKHLYINQVGLADAVNCIDKLKSLLAIYSFAAEDKDELVASILEVKTKPIHKCYPANLHLGYCHGLEYQLTIDEKSFPKRSYLLFGDVLQEFLSRLCALNSFVELVLIGKKTGEFFRWQTNIKSFTII
ncbi:MAG: type VI secretion system baseplate subunit TssF, partial [Pseudomonadota bacterium]